MFLDVVRVRGFWLNGRFIPIMAGAEGEGDGDEGSGEGEGEGGGEGSSEGAKGEGSGDGESADDDKGDGKDSKERKARGDLNRALNEARARERKAQAELEKYQKREKEAQEAEAKRKGEYQKLYEDSKAEREASEAALTARAERAERDTQLLYYLSEKHPAYVGRARFIRPLVREEIAAGASAEDATKVMHRVVADYVKEHPIATEGRGAPGGTPSGSSSKEGVLKGFPAVQKMMAESAPPAGG